MGKSQAKRWNLSFGDRLTVSFFVRLFGRLVVWSFEQRKGKEKKAKERQVYA